jgi:hypothetical protein
MGYEPVSMSLDVMDEFIKLVTSAQHLDRLLIISI